MRRGASSRLTRIQFTELRLDVDRAQPWELDGEFMGETRQLAIITLPGRLVLRLPADREQAECEQLAATDGIAVAGEAPVEPAAT